MKKVNDVTGWLSQTIDILKYFVWSPGLGDKESRLYFRVEIKTSVKLVNCFFISNTNFILSNCCQNSFLLQLDENLCGLSCDSGLYEGRVYVHALQAIVFVDLSMIGLKSLEVHIFAASRTFNESKVQ